MERTDSPRRGQVAISLLGIVAVLGIVGVSSSTIFALFSQTENRQEEPNVSLVMSEEIFQPDHFLCYTVKATRGSACAGDAPANIGGACESEADCGGEANETTFCVPNKFPKNLLVSLRDQFENKDFAIKKPLDLCVPADKNGEGIIDAATHLFSYSITAVKKSCLVDAPSNPLRFCTKEEECGGNSGVTSYCQRTPKHEKQASILVTNQFGNLIVGTLKPDWLLVPTAKDLTAPIASPDPAGHELDHFKCYTVKVQKGVCEDDPGVTCKAATDCLDAGLAGPCNLGFPKGLQVSLADQFTDPPKLFDVKNPTRLCLPVNKEGEGIKHPSARLLCYQVKPVAKVCAAEAPLNSGRTCTKESDCGGTRGATTWCQAQPKHAKVVGLHVNSQFGSAQFNTLKEDELCVPSLPATGAICGDDIATEGETCDGLDLQGEDCLSQGFAGGTLGCLPDCTGFDTSSCTAEPVCGDNLAADAEVCDGADLKGTDCLSQGFAGGILACLSDCTGFDTSNCTPELPPDPMTVAPALATSVATTLFTATEFLYTGVKPIQTDVPAGTIDPKRAAVLRGQVLNRGGTPLPGVTISIPNHPEFGQTLSRLDGRFDLVVNGGGMLTVHYEKTGLLPAQRQVNAPWREYTQMPEVVLIPLDPQVTPIDLTSPQPVQVARGSLVTDDDGARQATLLFPQGTTAELVLQNGSRQEITTLHVRATEYTVGENGPQAMPAELPPTSFYTYAVEISADETSAVDAQTVNFSQPIFFYVENFLGFPTGIQVPMGFYDKGKAAWMPTPDGRVIEILSISAELAELDTTGDGVADNGAALGITEAERRQLANLYAAGQSLWRIAITHFTSYDPNYGVVPEEGAEEPRQPPPTGGGSNKPDDSCPTFGSFIECQPQILGESVGLTGTPFTLTYASDRVPGRIDNNILHVPLSGTTVPAVLKRIDLTILVAGRSFNETFPPAPNLTHTFTWDGLDAYGRALWGEQPVAVTIDYVYDGFYALPPGLAESFGFPSGVPAPGDIPARDGTLLSLKHRLKLGRSPFRDHLGGWSIDVHHVYDPEGKVLHLGTGERRSAQNLNVTTLAIVAGTGQDGFSGDGGPATQATLNVPRDVVVAPDGGFYIADTENHRVRYVAPDGTITTVAGTGTPGTSGDGGQATSAELELPAGLALGPDDSLYIGSVLDARIRRVTNGVITTVVGTGVPGFSGDGGPASSAQIAAGTRAVAVAPDGTLYIADRGNHRIRRVAPDGVINTFAGTGAPDFSGDGGPATLAALSSPSDVALGIKGDVYIADRDNGLIRKVGPDGIITTAAGLSSPGYGSREAGSRFASRSTVGRLAQRVRDTIRWAFALPQALAAIVGGEEGAPATEVVLVAPEQVAVALDGLLFIAETDRIRTVDSAGLIRTLAGGGEMISDGMPAAQAYVDFPEGMSVAPDGSLYFADPGADSAAPDGVNSGVIRRIAPSLPGFTATEIAIPSIEGNKIYQFTAEGRHRRTLHALTGGTLFAFGYDPEGRLIEIKDDDNNTTTIEREANGHPKAIVAPFGQPTMLSLDENGYLATLANPLNEMQQFFYTTEGLLRRMLDPKGQEYMFTYDAEGRLSRDDDPAGGFQTLVRTDLENGYRVDKTTALNRTTTYQIERLASGSQRRLTTFPAGTQAEAQIGTDGTRTTTTPDGTEVAVVRGPDPRFAMQAPLPTGETTTTPGGLTRIVTKQRTATLANPTDLSSLLSLTEITDENGRAYTTVYDAASQTFTVTTPEGRQVTSTIDARGRRVHEQLGTLHPWSFSYDSRGRLERAMQGAGADERTTLFAYNDAGFLETITDPLGRITQFTHDAAGRIMTQTLPGARTTSFGYDSNGNVISITPPSRPAHLFDHTPVNLLTEYQPPDLGGTIPPTMSAYNGDRDLTRITRPDGLLREFAYDAAGRLERETQPGGQIVYTYDPSSGQLATIAAPSGVSLAFDYDGGLVTNISWTGTVAGAVSRSYDESFRLNELQVNGSVPMAFTYDTDNLLTQAGTLVLTRGPENGLITATTLGNVTDALEYNGFAELERYTARFDPTELYSFTLMYNKLGRITSRVETVDGTTDTFLYDYDPAGRLIEVTKNGSVIASYEYDDNGNRLSFSDASDSLAASYDDQDRLQAYGSATYTYTANGEVRSKTLGTATTTYEYDVRSNLTKVTLPAGAQIEYLVDGADRRVGKKVNGTLVQGLLYQSRLRPVAELDGNGQVVSRFVYGNKVNAPEYMLKGGVTYRLLSDHLGSVRLVVDATTGAVAQRIDYDAFGRVLTDTNPGFQPFGFAGGIYDPDTGLVRFGARDYEAETGRWTAKDPIWFSGGHTNLYVYVDNNPLLRGDPSGLQTALPPSLVERAEAERPLSVLREQAGIAGGRACKECERFGAEAFSVTNAMGFAARNTPPAEAAVNRNSLLAEAAAPRVSHLVRNQERSVQGQERRQANRSECNEEWQAPRATEPGQRGDGRDGGLVPFISDILGSNAGFLFVPLL